jgi:beta-galactosidase
MKFRTALLVAVVALAARVDAQRLDLELTEGWRFTRADTGPGVAATAGDPVTLPHTWNAADGQDGSPLTPSRTVVRGAADVRDSPSSLRPGGGVPPVEAASVDGRLAQRHAPVTSHRWRLLELTDTCGPTTPTAARARGQLLVEDVAPLQGDFTVFGGLYRPVHLIVTDPIAITPAFHASPGVFITQQRLAEDEAIVEVKTMLSSMAPGETSVEVGTIIHDAAGVVVARTRTPVRVAAGASQQPVAHTLAIPKPHRWNGREDPYLYSVEVSVHREGRTVYQVRQPLGLRTIAITDEQGVVLNGRPYATYGVNRHQTGLQPMAPRADTRRTAMIRTLHEPAPASTASRARRTDLRQGWLFVWQKSYPSTTASLPGPRPMPGSSSPR